jgi:2-polyprenyl-3-methyl-5-hydroxy-6-metoxy-1,4-benzoquinol methylase
MFKSKKRKNESILQAADEFTCLPDDEFVELLYTKLLGRNSDYPGKTHHVQSLKKGVSRISLVFNFIQSPEFINKILRENIHLVPIKDEKPLQFSTGLNRLTNESVWIFRVRGNEDFDWLEKKIVENGYYERQGVWLMDVDDDKRLLAEITLVFRPKKVLDFGCANGAIMKVLQEEGVGVKGVEISRMALDKAFPEVRPHIHLGDLRTLTFPSKFDAILGMDIFEHLNPNKLDGYIASIYELLEDPGLLLCNIPGYGTDPVFGEIHRVYLEDWEPDIRNKRIFRTIHVDNYGYPKNGHIICAGTDWWVERFERAGFRREQELETELHKKFDPRITQVSEARRSLYLFSKNAPDNTRENWQSLIDKD